MSGQRAKKRDGKIGGVSVHDVVGQLFNVPNTAVGLGYGALGHGVGAVAHAFNPRVPEPRMVTRGGRTEFLNNPFAAAGAITIGEVTTYGDDPYSAEGRKNWSGTEQREGHPVWEHERQHVLQGRTGACVSAVKCAWRSHGAHVRSRLAWTTELERTRAADESREGLASEQGAVIRCSRPGLAPATATGVAFVGLLLGACDPMPMISLKNETAGPVAVRFGSSGPNDYVPQKTYELEERRSVRFPAGYASSLIVVDDGRCLRTYPVLPDAAIDSGMGGNTPLAIGSDWRLYVRDPSAQPAGLPLSPLMKACR